jgi:hypothetical protein
VIIEFLTMGFLKALWLVLDAIPDMPVGSWDFAPAIGLMMALDASLPVHECLAAVAVVVALDVAIWAFDSFDWLYDKLPFV